MDDNRLKSVFNKVCLVAILLNEEQFLEEWIIYHKLLGITHFFLYDDNPAFPLTNFLRQHADYVTVIPWGGKEKNNPNFTNQRMAYRHAWKYYLKDYEWVVFLDADEFIVLKKHENVASFLAEFDEAAVALTWHVFGHNGYYEDPEDLVTVSLNRRRRLPFDNIKCFTRTKAIAEIPSPHICQLTNGIVVDANKKPFQKFYYPGKTDVAHINHYQTRSFKNWMKRAQEGISNFIIGDCPLEQLWRTSEERLLKEFVTMVALDRNEFIDDFMLKFSFDIRKELFKVKRNKNVLNEFPEIFAIEADNDLRNLLDLITANIHAIVNSLSLDSNVTDKAKVALYLLNYNYLFNDPKCEEIGLQLISDGMEKFSLGRSEGILVFSAVIEILHQKCVINVNTDEILEDVDDFLHYEILINNELNKDSANFSKINIGNYFLLRLNNLFRAKSSAIKPNIINTIIAIANSIEGSSDDFNNACSTINYLVKCYKHLPQSAKVKAKNNCDNAALLIKKKLIDNTFTLDFLYYTNPIETVIILLNASNVFNEKRYSLLAQEILLKYEINEGLKWNADPLSLWISYHRLHTLTLSNHYKLKSLNLIKKSLDIMQIRLYQIDDQTTDAELGIIAHSGIILQYIFDKQLAEVLPFLL